MLSGKQKSYLRSAANTLDSIIQIGKGGISETVVRAVDQALTARELVKVTVLNNCLDPVEAVAVGLAGATGGQIVQQVGKKIVIYRPNPENPVYDLAQI